MNNGPYRSSDISKEPKMSLIDEFIDKLMKVDANDFSHIRNESTWKTGHLGLLYVKESGTFQIEWSYNEVMVDGWNLPLDPGQRNKLGDAYRKIVDQTIDVTIQNVLDCLGI